jgi:hypothetical protein
MCHSADSLLSSLRPPPEPSPLYGPNAHLTCPLSHLECPPHLPVHHHLHPLDALTFTLFPCPSFKLYTPPSTGTLTRSRRCNLYGVIGGRTKSAGMAHPTRGLSCPHWAVQNDQLSGSGTTGGRSPHRTDNPHHFLPPISASPCCQMSCGCRG